MLSERLRRARDFMLLNARLLERRLFAHDYEGGDGGSVVAALMAYRNPDGGFGAALEPDKRAPPSQPQDVEVAFRTLDAVGALGGDIAAPVCDWLTSVTTEEGGVPYSLASANDYPHAPWWAVEEPSPPANLNPTAAILGLLLKNDCEHRWIEGAARFCWAAIEASQSTAFHELACTSLFLEHAPDRRRGRRLLDAIVERVAAANVVALDPDAEGYVQKPLDFAPTPENPFRRIFADRVIARHIAALAARQQADGGWPLTWQAISPAVEAECRGRVTLAALGALRAYGA